MGHIGGKKVSATTPPERAATLMEIPTGRRGRTRKLGSKKLYTLYGGGGNGKWKNCEGQRGKNKKGSNKYCLSFRDLVRVCTACIAKQGIRG